MIKQFINECKSFMNDNVHERYIERFAYGVDASCYRYIPKLVLKPRNESEVQKIILLSQQYGIPLTFRASGTSLSGQACSDSVLVVCMKHWDSIEVREDSIVCGCGVIGVEANISLKHLGKKIGPDPATINNASIGGIFSNNSSGMCCGVKQNSYQTIKSIRVILHDGFLLDTADKSSINDFINTHSTMVDEIMALREEIVADNALCNEIKRKFAIKNTTGYGINSFVDFDDIKDILNHIFIGAEGTLGFISRIEYYSVEDFKHKACALLFYENLSIASHAIEILASNDNIISAAEIMDYACLMSIVSLQGLPRELDSIKVGNCCILIQLESNDIESLKSNIDFISTQLESVPTLFGVKFSFDRAEQDSWWKIRKGILPLAAANKPKGSTVITEDICFEINNFARGIDELTDLFRKYEFDGIIFGHALSGNVHFIITPLLDDVGEVDRFAKFMDAMANLVVSLKGSTKAEHGTGRMVAPFVELEWGSKAYAINKRIKKIFDPHNLFNPDVIICDDPNIHIKNLKPTYSIDEFMDSCMECGFCEKVCPSKDITLSPRQRIAVFREIQRLESKSNRSNIENEELESLKSDYKYYGVQTCATCSMCSMICPLEIDSAKIAININNSNSKGIGIARSISNNLNRTIKFAKFSVGVANAAQSLFGNENVKNVSLFLNNKIGTPIIPKSMPRSNAYKLESKDNGGSENVVYFTSCLNRIFAPNAKDKRSIQEVFESLCKKAKINCFYPKNISNMCCGKAFKDFSLKDPTLNPIYQSLKEIKEEFSDKKYVVVCDHSACSGEIIAKLKDSDEFGNMVFKDVSEFVYTNILPYLSINPLSDDVGLYSVCSSKKYGFSDNLKNIAKSCTSGAIIEHTQTHCCGFAGNKGFITPKLNNSALDSFGTYFATQNLKHAYSSSSTCEIGLSDKTNIQWQHIIYLLDEVSK